MVSFPASKIAGLSQVIGGVWSSGGGDSGRCEIRLSSVVDAREMSAVSCSGSTPTPSRLSDGGGSGGGDRSGGGVSGGVSFSRAEHLSGGRTDG